MIPLPWRVLLCTWLFREWEWPHCYSFPFRPNNPTRHNEIRTAGPWKRATIKNQWTMSDRNKSSTFLAPASKENLRQAYFFDNREKLKLKKSRMPLRTHMFAMMKRWPKIGEHPKLWMRDSFPMFPKINWDTLVNTPGDRFQPKTSLRTAFRSGTCCGWSWCSSDSEVGPCPKKRKTRFQSCGFMRKIIGRLYM